MLVLHVATLCQFAEEKWRISLDRPTLRALTGLRTPTLRQWCADEVRRFDFSVMGVWCHLFWCHPHELLMFGLDAPSPASIRRPESTLLPILSPGGEPLSPLPVTSRIPQQLDHFSSHQQGVIRRQIGVSPEAARTNAHAVSRRLLDGLCTVLGGGVQDFLVVDFPQTIPVEPVCRQEPLSLRPRTDVPEDFLEAVAALPPRERQPLGLRYHLFNEGWHTLDEIADQLQMPRDRVAEAERDARQHLQQQGYADQVDSLLVLP